MSEDEILEIIKDHIDNGMTNKTVKLDTIIYLDEAIKELYSMYQTEKEKNKKLQIRGKELIEEKQELNTALLYDNISKDKIKAKIKELEEKSDYWNCDEIEVLKELLEEK